MPTSDLDEAKALAQKLKRGQIKKGRLLDDTDNDESSDDSKENEDKSK